MRAILICPSAQRFALCFQEREPPALTPLLGRTMLDRALIALAAKGVTQVTLIASDRPACIRTKVADGSQWGIKIDIISVAADPSPEEARALCPGGGEVAVLGGWPEDGPQAELPTTREWFRQLLSHMEGAGATAVGMRELMPGVWIGTHAKISAETTLHAPCWIGQQAVIARNTIIGPNAVVERCALVDEGAEIVDSFVAPSTYVGAYLELRNSVAVGRRLANWQADTMTEVPDAVLLNDLNHFSKSTHSSWLGRAIALAILCLGSPLAIVAWWRARGSDQFWITSRRVVRAPLSTDQVHISTFALWQFPPLRGLPRRLPELWSIAKGDLAWIGNRPLTPTQVEQLGSDYERLWLTVPPGHISLADAQGHLDDSDTISDDACAHAAFYAACRGLRLNLSILVRTLRLQLRLSHHLAQARAPFSYIHTSEHPTTLNPNTQPI